VTVEAERIMQAALTLSDDERAELIVVLRDSLGESVWTSEQIEAAWIAEAQRRLEAVRSGQEQPIAADVVDAELEAIIEQAESHSRLAG
jgi:putative addiction module component (TIGR02574 family)